MRPRDIIESVKSLVPTLLECEKDRPGIWIHGAPGAGKTDCVVQAFLEMQMTLWRFPPTITLDPVDVRGLPNIGADGRTVWARPDLWPDDEDFVGGVFIDELPQGTTAVQSSLMQAVHGGRIGNLILPKKIVFIACGNRQEDRAGANRVITPLLNRFLHLDFEVSNDDWQAWAIAAGVAPEVRGFLNFRSNLLHAFDPSLNERAFPTPRSWNFVSKVLNSTPGHLLHQVIGGLVGDGPAAEFVAFFRTYRDLPDLDEALKIPQKAAFPKDNPATMYALCTALSEKSRSLKNLDPLAIYGKRFPDEFSALCMREVYAANCPKSAGGKLIPDPKLFKGEMLKWVSLHGDCLLEEAKNAK